MRTETHTLPAYWASYMINGDASGISDEDKAQADAYLAKNKLPAPVDCGEQYFSRYNDAGTLAGDVCGYTFLLNDSHVDEGERATLPGYNC